MRFSELTKYWEGLEKIDSRNKMMEVLAQVLKEARAEEVDKVCYLSLGRLGPLYRNVEFNLAEKLMIKAVAQAYRVEGKELRKEFKKKGDLGIVVEELGRKRTDRTHTADITVSAVFEKLLQIAKEEGTGSQERKLNMIEILLGKLDPISAKFIVRIPLKKMRLGFSDKTILDALSFMERGDKSAKKELEEAYEVRPDIGLLSKVVKEKGIEGVREVQEPEAGVPILMAQAKRMNSAEEILLKIGRCAVEPKIDGFRLQIHYVASQKTNSKKQIAKIENDEKNNNRTIEQLDNVKLFTRNLDNVTHMYPDIVEAVGKQIKAESAIFEGEAVAYSPKTGEYLPFQETVQRKRKYDIVKFAKDVPLRLIVFELLYLDGKSLLGRPYSDRRKKLEKIIVEKKDFTIIIAEEHEVEKEEELEKLFDKAVGEGLEGVMAKRLNAPYTAGARNWNWIKYKRSYSGELADTLDCAVLGYDYGKGKRTQFGIGAFLAGVYDNKNEIFKTVSKIGTGLTDKQWRDLKVKCQKSNVKSKPKEYEVDKLNAPDVWVAPGIVIEIEADEITRSPAHTAGLALRFPRLKRFRDDKRPEQTTTLGELTQMYKAQGRHGAN